MRKVQILSVVFMLLLLIIIYKTSNVDHYSSDMISPEDLYETNPDIDMFIYNKSIFVNASDLDWVMTLDITPDSFLFQIETKYNDGVFKERESTVLEVGSEVYLARGRSDILLVKDGETFVRYIAWIEG